MRRSVGLVAIMLAFSACTAINSTAEFVDLEDGGTENQLATRAKRRPDDPER